MNKKSYQIDDKKYYQFLNENGANYQNKKTKMSIKQLVSEIPRKEINDVPNERVLKGLIHNYIDQTDMSELKDQFECKVIDPAFSHFGDILNGKKGTEEEQELLRRLKQDKLIRFEMTIK